MRIKQNNNDQEAPAPPQQQVEQLIDVDFNAKLSAIVAKVQDVSMEFNTRFFTPFNELMQQLQQSKQHDFQTQSNPQFEQRLQLVKQFCDNKRYFLTLQGQVALCDKIIMQLDQLNMSQLPQPPQPQLQITDKDIARRREKRKTAMARIGQYEQSLIQQSKERAKQLEDFVKAEYVARVAQEMAFFNAQSEPSVSQFVEEQVVLEQWRKVCKLKKDASEFVLTQFMQ